MGSTGGPTTGTGETDDERQLSCACCGGPIEATDWHPVRTRTDGDGEFHIDAFCSPECRAAMDATE